MARCDGIDKKPGGVTQRRGGATRVQKRGSGSTGHGAHYEGHEKIRSYKGMDEIRLRG